MRSDLTLPELDGRHLADRHGDAVYEIPHYASLAAWEARAHWLRRHLLCVQGLWPMPERTPLKSQVSGRHTYADYTVEKIYFESWPGFFCTGNLFRPRRAQGPSPAILNPHGHWPRGRLEHQRLGSIRARCITFARMGMVALAYDMVGVNDSLQVPGHRFASLRGALWGLTPMALQTWNSVRAIDFLQSLEDVDPERIGCTGASGGGTQTFMVTAIDDRIKVAAPVNMISAHFQGGCVCENTPGLRTQTSNMEIGALTAPRPLLMVSASGDWTVNTPAVEFPAIQSIYRLYEAGERLACAQVAEQHNYNAESRGHVYRWFARWFLGNERAEEAVERAFEVEPDERLRVFPTGELPSGSLTFGQVESSLRARAQADLRSLLPETRAQLARVTEITQTRLRHALEVTAPDPKDAVAELSDWVSGDGWESRDVLLGRRDMGDRVSAALYRSQPEAAGTVWLVVHPAGRTGLQDSFGQPGTLVRQLLRRGHDVLALEPFATGPVYRGVRPGRESSAPEAAAIRPRHDRDWFWLTFNPTLLGSRVQDILTALAYLGQDRSKVVGVIGVGAAGPWALLAAALCDIVRLVAVDLPPDHDDPYWGDLFAPALRAYGDVRVGAALLAPRTTLLAHLADGFPLDWAQAAYRTIGVSGRLSTTAEELTAALADWLDRN